MRNTGRSIMTIYSLFLIALALSLDAFGVALSIGLNRSIRLRNKAIFSMSFGFFQYLFSLVGAYAGLWFTMYIAAVPAIIGGIIIAIVGALMIKEGLDEKEECLLFSPKMYLVLGVSVSIDALVIGFTALSGLGSNIVILESAIFIGVITFIITGAAFILSRFLNRIAIISRYADYIGGIILVVFGLKMIFFH
jgi:manganese efflux pump family protein